MESGTDSGFVFEKISRKENGQLLVNDDGQIGCFGLMNGVPGTHMRPIPFLVETGCINVFKSSYKMKDYDTDMALDEYEARSQDLVARNLERITASFPQGPLQPSAQHVNTPNHTNDSGFDASYTTLGNSPGSIASTSARNQSGASTSSIGNQSGASTSASSAGNQTGASTSALSPAEVSGLCNDDEFINTHPHPYAKFS